MKKIIILFFIILFQTSVINAESPNEIKRIFIGKSDAKITIIIYESLTCSHCANFHINILPDLKREYIDTGIAKLEFRQDALKAIAKKAIELNTGARGLRSILENMLMDTMFELPSKSNIEEVVINEDVILKGLKPLTVHSKKKKGVSGTF